MTTPLNTAKAAVRRSMKAKLRTLDTAEISAQSEKVMEKLRALEAFQRAQRVSMYVSLPSEIQTQSLIREMLKKGKHVFLPRYRESTTEMDMVQVPSEAEFDSMPLTKWNIPQPPMDAPWKEAIEAGGLDLVICPGVAFTSAGHRLGHGMGYYDRYLTKLQTSCPNKKATLVGLALSVQVLPDAELPRGPTDVTLHHIVHA